jgi:hypothetical protein
MPWRRTAPCIGVIIRPVQQSFTADLGGAAMPATSWKSETIQQKMITNNDSCLALVLAKALWAL